MNLSFYDAHNHLQDVFLAPHISSITGDLIEIRLKRCVVNGTCETDWPDVARLCARADFSTGALRVLPSFGLHPWDVGNRSPAWLDHLRTHLDSHPGAGVGEIGLDRWMIDRARPDDPRLQGLRRAPLEEQIEVFRTQLSLAAERNLPASIHCLDAFGPLLDVLKSSRLPGRGFLLHAYSGSEELAVAFTKLGAFFSFNGAFLDARKDRLHALYQKIPFDRLLVETDAPAMSLPKSSPYLDEQDATRVCELPPAPDGQAINHPANIARTYAGLASLRGIDVTSLAEAVEKNFARLFG